MKALQVLFRFLYVYRLFVMMGLFLVVFVARVWAQDPISVIQALPAEFNWLWFVIGVLGMPIHFLKQVIWKETTIDQFDDHFFKNFQWTLGALLTILIGVAAQTDLLKTLPIFSVSVIVACLMVGFSADSGVNSPGNKVSAKAPPAARTVPAAS
jgi:hypothetical protein